MNVSDALNVSDAVSMLWAHGYRANASTLYPGYVTVLDPVRTLPTGETPARVEYRTRTIHALGVPRFITERN